MSTDTSTASSTYIINSVGSATVSAPSIGGNLDQHLIRRLAAEKVALEKAVYWHIRAVRTVGHTVVNTSDIAAALGVSIADVESTLAALEEKGVRAAP